MMSTINGVPFTLNILQGLPQSNSICLSLMASTDTTVKTTITISITLLIVFVAMLLVIFTSKCTGMHIQQQTR